MASEVRSDLKIELSDLNYLWSHVSLASICHYFKNFLWEEDKSLPETSGALALPARKKLKSAKFLLQKKYH